MHFRCPSPKLATDGTIVLSPPGTTYPEKGTSGSRRSFARRLYRFGFGPTDYEIKRSTATQAKAKLPDRLMEDDDAAILKGMPFVGETA